MCILEQNACPRTPMYGYMPPIDYKDTLLLEKNKAPRYHFTVNHILCYFNSSKTKTKYKQPTRLQVPAL